MLFVSIEPDSDQVIYPLVVASIRDESFIRPSRQVHFWDKNQDLVAGMDCNIGREGGTWFGMNRRRGKISALLNVLRPKSVSSMRGQIPLSKLARGSLTVDYLESPLPGDQFISSILPASRRYEGFTLVNIDLMA